MRSSHTAVEKTVQPKILKQAEILDGVGMESAPALRGYVRFTSRPTADATNVGERDAGGRVTERLVHLLHPPDETHAVVRDERPRLEASVFTRVQDVPHVGDADGYSVPA